MNDCEEIGVLTRGRIHELCLIDCTAEEWAQSEKRPYWDDRPPHGFCPDAPARYITNPDFLLQPHIVRKPNYLTQDGRLPDYKALLRYTYTISAWRKFHYYIQGRDDGDNALWALEGMFYELALGGASLTDLGLTYEDLEQEIREAYKRLLERAPHMDMLEQAFAKAIRSLGREKAELQREHPHDEEVQELDAASDFATAHRIDESLTNRERAERGLAMDIRARILISEGEALLHADETLKKRKG